jgi:hypothetical protein
MALKVSIEGLRFRARDGKFNAADQLRILQQRLNGSAGITRIRAGDNPEARSGYLVLRQLVTETKIEAIEISTVTAAQVKVIDVPEMIDDPRLPFKVARGVATGGQIAGLVKAGYEITGNGADYLKEVIADESKAAKGIGYIALLDGRALAKELNRQNPGRKFRVPTDPELLKLNKVVGDKISYRNLWIWTETETKANSGIFVLRRLAYAYRSAAELDPGDRNHHGAVRFVEDR